MQWEPDGSSILTMTDPWAWPAIGTNTSGTTQSEARMLALPLARRRLCVHAFTASGSLDPRAFGRRLRRREFGGSPRRVTAPVSRAISTSRTRARRSSRCRPRVSPNQRILKPTQSRRLPPVLRMFHLCSNPMRGRRNTKAPVRRYSLKPGPWIGAEHRVRTGDLRLGKANRRRHQRFPLLHNHHQPWKIVRAPYRQSSARFTNAPHPYTAFLSHTYSNTAQSHSTWPRSP